MTETPSRPAPGSNRHDPELVHVVETLHEEFDERLGGELVDATLDRVATQFAGATVHAFIPLLVRRYSREDLLGRVSSVDLRDEAGAQRQTSRSG